MRKQKGFSLIELLIVVAIILIIAAIAVPNLLRSRMAANEASAVGSVRSINTSEVTYASTYADIGYTGLAQLGSGALTPCPAGTASKTTACLVDPTIAGTGDGTSVHSGYQFQADAGAPPAGTTVSVSFAAGAYAAACNTTGMRSFYSDDSLVIRFDATGKCPKPPKVSGDITFSPLQ
jgi:prepilin-type N-terminal cleavage/methylation domain-containing protein